MAAWVGMLLNKSSQSRFCMMTTGIHHAYRSQKDADLVVKKQNKHKQTSMTATARIHMSFQIEDQVGYIR